MKHFIPPLFALLIFLAFPAIASLPQETRAVEQASQKLAQSIQAQVDDLNAQRQADFQEWRQIRRETLLLEAHNQRLAEWNANLAEQIEQLDQQLDSLATTREELEPLMQQMLVRLEDFVRHDLPFQQQKRLAKIADLKDLLSRVDVSHAEKLRQLLATYRSEVNQGRQLSFSREFTHLPEASEAERVTLLRLGRIGLYYLSEDQQRAGVWNAAQARWEALNSRQRAEVAKGLELAEERGLPELLNLPLSVPLRSAAEMQ